MELKQKLYKPYLRNRRGQKEDQSRNDLEKEKKNKKIKRKTCEFLHL